jgi:hypothetical protein
MRLWMAGIGLALLLQGCAARRGFVLLPGVLRAPDGVETPVGETLAGIYNQREGWVDLQPGMTLKLERAYFKSATAARRLENYVGLETALYRVGARGNLVAAGVTVLPQRPGDQAGVGTVLRGGQTRLRAQRLYFQVVLDKASGASSAVLLSAASRPRILRVGDLGAVCAGAKAEAICQVFPEGNSVSLAFDVTVNDGVNEVVKNLLWGSTLGSVVGAAKSFSLERVDRGKLTKVKIEPGEAEARKLPLLPGDRISF